MRSSYEMALEFHRALGLPVGDIPVAPGHDRVTLRVRLIAEEVAELVAAMGGHDQPVAEALGSHLTRLLLGYVGEHGHPVDVAAIAKEAVDVHVVVSGAAVEYGINEDAVYAEVHRSNLAKAGGERRADGKVLKPKGWLPPDVSGLLDPAWALDRRAAGAVTALDRNEWLHGHAGEPT